MGYCHEKGITFFSTAFDNAGLEYLNHLGFDRFKIPSGEITNYPYLKLLSDLHEPVILSTGMADIDEVGEAIQALCSEKLKVENITVLHCNTEYPTPMADVNLKAILTIGERFGVEVGYSDHTLGIEVPIAVVAQGSQIIEKHFTLDKSLPCPDHSSSLDPTEFGQLVHGIREIEKSLGHGIKTPSPSESRNIFGMKKSLVFIKDLTKGSVIDESCIGFKRPSNGLEPKMLDKILGKKVTQDVKVDEPVQYASVSW